MVASPRPRPSEPTRHSGAPADQRTPQAGAEATATGRHPFAAVASPVSHPLAAPVTGSRPSPDHAADCYATPSTTQSPSAGFPARPGRTAGLHYPAGPGSRRRQRLHIPIVNGCVMVPPIRGDAGHRADRVFEPDRIELGSLSEPQARDSSPMRRTVFPSRPVPAADRNWKKERPRSHPHRQRRMPSSARVSSWDACSSAAVRNATIASATASGARLGR